MQSSKQAHLRSLCPSFLLPKTRRLVCLNSSLSRRACRGWFKQRDRVHASAPAGPGAADPAGPGPEADSSAEAARPLNLHQRLCPRHRSPSPRRSSSSGARHDVFCEVVVASPPPTHRMLGRSIPEYIFIRICVFCLRAVTPLSILYTTYWSCLRIWGHDTHCSVYSTSLVVYAGLEASFYFLVYLPRHRRLQEVSYWSC